MLGDLHLTSPEVCPNLVGCVEGGLQGVRPGLGTLPVGWYVAVLGENGAGEGANSGLCSHVISKELCLRGLQEGETHKHTHTHTCNANTSATVREADVNSRRSMNWRWKRPEEL